MRLLVLITLFVTLASAQDTGAAETSTLAYNEALAAAMTADADVLGARLELASAERALSRIQADPLALRIPVLQAEQAAESARQALRTAELGARSGASSAYAAALEADSDVALAEQRLSLSQTEAEATRIRLEAGAATSLDVDRSENALRDAERTLENARQNRELAYSNLASSLGLSAQPTLSETVPVGEVPPLDEVLAGLDANAQLRSAENALELARAQQAATDNAFSAKSDIDAANDDLESATTFLSEVRRTLELGVRQSYNAVIAAQGQLERTLADLTTARENVGAQQLRFDAGSISRLELGQSQLELSGAEAEAQRAAHALSAALFSLELSVQGANGAL